MASSSTIASAGSVLLAVSLACVSAGGPVPWSQVLKQDAAWYASAEARGIAQSVLAYQHPSGGWPKNLDMTTPPAAALEEQAAAPTIDNQATFTQIRFLARVHLAAPDARYRDAALRGIDYLLAAQYPNGGWPQYFPVRNDYSRHITFNDGAMIGVMTLLDETAAGASPFAFVDARRRAAAAAAVARGVAVILQSQVKVDGVLTAWCAQHDAVTLAPARARAYEHPSLSGEESVGIVRFLMRRGEGAQDPAVAAAVEAAVAWFRRVTIEGWRLERRQDAALPGGFDRVMVRDPDAPPLWARFYEIGTNRPIFSGRDGVIRYSLAEIEHERRTHYEWVGDWPRQLLERDYPRWKARRAHD